MSIGIEVSKNWNSIFKGDIDFKNFLKSISGPDGSERCIDEWDPDSDDMIPSKDAKTTSLRVVPRIKVKTERDWLRGKIKGWFEENRDLYHERLLEHLPRDKGQVYVTEISEGSSTGTGLLTLKVTTQRQDNGNKLVTVFEIRVQPKGLSNGTGGKREDPHELMTAILILMKKRVNVEQLSRKNDGERQTEYLDLVKELEKNASKVVGASGVSGFYIDPKTKQEPDLINLAKALSVSNYIIDEIGNAKVNAVWQTGKTWAPEISKFNVGPKTIKNYNSSDIIVKFTTSGKNSATHYWGLSLKKKGIGEAEPTLLNKPLMGKTGFLSKKLKDTGHIQKVEDAKKKFFTEAVKRKLGGVIYKKKDVTKVQTKELLKIANELFTERQDKNHMLTGRGIYQGNKNIYFEALHNAFMEFDGDQKFFEEFIDTIFKIKLDSYVNDVSFHFSLITGEGDYIKSKIMEVKKPTEKEGRTTEEVFRQIFGDPDNTTYRLIPGRDNRSNDKKMAFEDGAEAAKLYYEMVIGPRGNEHSIVMLEVRYKGTLTSEPQFQVFMSTKKDGFSDLYKKYASGKGNLRRW
jgi:hypothetical protein